MKKNEVVDKKIDDLLADLPSGDNEYGGGVSGLTVRALATEDLAWVSGGEGYDEYGGTETVQQGLSCDTKNDGGPFSA